MEPVVSTQPVKDFFADQNGSLASRWLKSGLSTEALRTNALLRKHDWERIDSTVVGTMAQHMNGVQDLIGRGLIENLGGLGVMVSTYEKLSDMEAAEVNMSGVTAGNRDRAEFSAESVPVPIVHKDFQLNVRHIDAARRNGGNLSLDHATLAARLVAEKLESMLFIGAPSVVVSGATIYGYTTYTSRQTISTSADWGTSANIFSSVRAMLEKLIISNFPPPFTLYVNPVQYSEALVATGTDIQMTAIQRLTQNYGGLLESVKMSYACPAGSAVMVKLSKEVIDYAYGQFPTTVEWNEMGGMVGNFKVMACAAPRPKSTADGVTGCGIVHHNGI